MVHIHFVRKRVSIYIKLILFASLLVYLLSFFGKILVRNGSKNGINRLHVKKQKAKTSRQRKSAVEMSQMAHELSLLDRWKAYAKKMFGNLKVGSDLHGRLNVHRWYSICGNTIDNLRRHVLFPKHPKLRTYITVLRMRTKLSNFGERVFGYIHPPLNGLYQFAVSSDDFSEVWLSTDSSPNNTKLICQVGGLIKGRYVMGFTKPDEFTKYDSQISQNIYMDGNKKYFFEVLHKQANGESHLRVAWKMPGLAHFMVITSEFISLFTKEDYTRSSLKHDDHEKLPEVILQHHKHIKTHYTNPAPYKNFTFINNTISHIPLLPLAQKNLPLCGKQYDSLSGVLKRYRGRHFTQVPNVYPPDGSNLVVQICQYPKSYSECKGNPFMEKKEAEWIAQAYLNSTRLEGHSLKSLVRVEDVADKRSGNRHYFFELILRNKIANKTVRVADHVIFEMNSKQFCNPVPNSWNPDVTIYVIITVKNQGIWLRHFIDNMAEIGRETGDKNIHPIIVDFGSNDIDIDDYLKLSDLEYYTVIHKKGAFYKTSAINEAAASVKNNNSIIFQLDLHLDVPINLMQLVRKHTIQSHMAFAPLLTRLSCGSSPDFPAGHWEEQGYGLFAIYKSDWIRFGGMNEREFSHHWGGEDWEMIDRVVMQNVVIQKLKMPGLFHYYHNRQKMWDKAV